MEYVIVRCTQAGCFAGYLESRNGQEATLRKARRLWYWKGAATLSQMAMEGVKCPDECKFPCEVDKVIVLDAAEIINTTPEAEKNLREVPVWKI